MSGPLKTVGHWLSGPLGAGWGKNKLYWTAFGVSQRNQEMMKTKGASQRQRMAWTLTLIWINGMIRRRQWHPTPVLLPGKSHGRRRLVGCSPWGCKKSDTTEWLPFHFSLSCIGEENGNPLQRSCLENPRDGEAWWAAIYGVAQSWTRLRWLSSSSSSNGMIHLVMEAQKSQEGSSEPSSRRMRSFSRISKGQHLGLVILGRAQKSLLPL